DLFKPEALEQVVRRSARILKVEIEPAAAHEIAVRARGTPRIANRWLKRVRDYAQVRHDGKVTLPVTREALAALEVDDAGLDDRDRSLLRAITDKFGGGPVGLETLAAAVSEDSETIEDVYEPYLLQEGYLKRTPRGRVSPLEFIPEAEATGLIRRLTFWVLREALLQSNVWRRDGAAIPVAVNLSVDNLHDAHFRRFMELTLKVAGGPELLIMEVSSRALARDPDPPIPILDLMRDQGIRVTLDDATDEDAHLVEKLRLDIVKVSRALVSRMGRDHRALEYVRAVV